MATADFDLEDFEDRTRSDAKAFVRFFYMPLKDEKASLKAGRPIHNDVEMCEIIVPGNQTNKPIKRVNDIIRQRYRIQYRKWKESGNAESTPDGTALSEVAWITRSQVEELAYFQVRTLEQLAQVNDDFCSRVPGLLELRRKAKFMIDKAEEAAPFQQLQAQIDELKGLLQVKDQTIEELAKQVKAKKAKDKEE